MHNIVVLKQLKRKIDMRVKIRATLLFVMLLVVYESLLADINSFPNIPKKVNRLKIDAIEQLPYFCGARLNVLVKNIDSGYENLRYVYKIKGGSWSSPQVSSTFIFSREKIKEIGTQKLKFGVKYVKDNAYKKSDFISIIDKQAVVDVTFNSKEPNCEDASGSIEAIVKGGWRYLTFDGTFSSIVELPKQFLNNLSAFTMEGDVKLNENVSGMPEYVGAFGIDNVLEFGFRNGKPAAYISYYTGTINSKRKVSFDQTASSLFPNDRQWHNMVVRSDGSKLEILIDGNIVASDSRNFLYLTPDAAGVHNVTIGSRVWNQNDRGLKGDVSRVSFWNRALSNTELRELRGNPPTPSSSGLIASYSLDVRDENFLYAVVPNAENAEEYTGIIRNAQWSDKILYVLEKKINGKYEIIKTGSTRNTIIGDLSEGDYKFNVTYDAGECQNNAEELVFTLNSTLNLSADISMEAADNICEGDDITLKIDEVHGGVEGQTPNYQWMKQQEDGTFVNIPDGVSANQIVKVDKGSNIYKVHIETKNGKCRTTITKELKKNAYAKIKTQLIRRSM